MCSPKKLYLIVCVFLSNTLEQILLQCSGVPINDYPTRMHIISLGEPPQNPIKFGIYEKETTVDWPIRITIAPQEMESEIQKELSRRWIKLDGTDKLIEKDVKILTRDLLETQLKLNAAENVIKKKDSEIKNKVTEKCSCNIFDMKK